MINFRKIASVFASTVMLGSSVALAAAANYPAPFVQSGKADVAIVWGAASAQSDLVAVTDITTSLGAALARQTASSSGSSASTSTVTGGDFVQISKSSDNFNLGNTMSGVFGATVDDDDLQDLLADGTYLNDENTEYDYEQKFTLQARQLTYFADSDHEDKTPTVGFQIGSNVPVLNYTLDFTTDAESDVSSGDLVDFETTDLMLFGKRYYILDAKLNTSASAYFGKFTLLDSANTVTVSQGETETITVGDRSYEVGISFINADEARIVVNGETANSLSEGETFRLKDGTYVGVKDILFDPKDAGTSKVEISIGTGKIEVEAGSDIELNDESIDGIKGWFVRGTTSGSKERLDKVIIEWSTDDEAFISESTDLSMPGFNAVKFSMGDFVTPETEMTEVDYDGDDSVELSIPFKDGTKTVNILFANATVFTGIGKDSDERLATSANSTLSFVDRVSSNDYHQYFVATYNTTDDAESYLLSATTTNTTSTGARVTIKNEVTGENVCQDKAAADTCDIGDVSLTITSIQDSGTDKNVLLTAGTNTNFNTVFTAEGLKIYLPVAIDGSAIPATAKGAINFSGASTVAGHSGASFYTFFDEEDQDDNKGAGNSFNVTLDIDSDGDVHVTDIDTGSTEHDVPDTSDDTVSMVVSDLATKVTRKVSSDRGSASIEYHGSESYADVFLTDTSAAVSSNGTSGGNVKDLGSIAVRDNEVSSVTGKNLIVVGGSCVNTVAAELLGASSPLCGAAFESSTGVGAGEFLIQTFSRTGGKVATLVAGYNADDTGNAAKYLTTQTSVDVSAGKKYVGTSATSASLQTA